MGGRAFIQKGIETRRVSKDEYDEIYLELFPKLSKLFGTVELVKSYDTKETFGDMDILVKDYKYPNKDIKLVIYGEFETDIIKNGNVYSLVYKDVQIDIIKVKSSEWETTRTYYAYNDLGNLMGRIARQMGFRYGSQGLFYSYKSRYGFYAQDVIVSMDVPKIFNFLGFDYELYLMGFETLEEVFNFVVSSKYFTPTIFQYENLDHTNRLRNRKRDSYRKFLEYIKDMDGSSIVEVPKDKYYSMAINFFGSEFTDKLSELSYHDDITYEIRQKFNGNIVSQITHLEGKELGEFISKFKQNYDNFDSFILNADLENIKLAIKDYFKNNV